MDFEILMEGTMIGAELKVLSEADLTAAAAATNPDQFVDAVAKAFEDDATELLNRAKHAKEVARKNLKILKDNTDKIVEFVKNQDSEDNVKLLKALIGKDANSMTTKDEVMFLIGYLDELTVLSNHVIRLTALNRKEIKRILKEYSPILKKNFKAADTKVKSKLGDIKVVAKQAEAVGVDAIDKSKGLLDQITEVFQTFHEVEREYNWFGKVLNKFKITAKWAKYFSTEKKMSIKQAMENHNNLAENFNKFLGNSIITEVITLEKQPILNIDLLTVKDPEKSEKQAVGAIGKLKQKFKELIAKISKTLNEPTIANIAVSVGVALASYLVLFGFVKSAGQDVNVINIPGVFKGAIAVIKEGSFAKKLVIISLITIVIAALAAAGKMGYSYIKNKLANKK